MSDLRELVGTRWSGEAELWLDPLGNEAERCDCTLAVDDGGLSYTWSYRGKPHEGSLRLRAGGADFTDTWHSATVMPCDDLAPRWALLDVRGTYGAGQGPDWGWRITVSLRPSDELILQMTNIAPWGEDARAVRMICRRA